MSRPVYLYKRGTKRSAHARFSRDGRGRDDKNQKEKKKHTGRGLLRKQTTATVFSQFTHGNGQLLCNGKLTKLGGLHQLNYMGAHGRGFEIVLWIFNAVVQQPTVFEHVLFPIRP